MSINDVDRSHIAPGAGDGVDGALTEDNERQNLANAIKGSIAKTTQLMHDEIFHINQDMQTLRAKFGLTRAEVEGDLGSEEAEAVDTLTRAAAFLSIAEKNSSAWEDLIEYKGGD